MTEQQATKELIKNRKLDLGFCTLTIKPVNGGKGKSHNTSFKIGKFYKLGVQMSKEFKAKINK